MDDRECDPGSQHRFQDVHCFLPCARTQLAFLKRSRVPRDGCFLSVCAHIAHLRTLPHDANGQVEVVSSEAGPAGARTAKPAGRVPPLSTR